MREDAQVLLLTLQEELTVSHCEMCPLQFLQMFFVELSKFLFISGITIQERFYSVQCVINIILCGSFTLLLFFPPHSYKETNQLVYPFPDLREHFTPGNNLFDKSIFLPTSGVFFQFIHVLNYFCLPITLGDSLKVCRQGINAAVWVNLQLLFKAI